MFTTEQIRYGPAPMRHMINVTSADKLPTLFFDRDFPLYDFFRSDMQ